MVLGTQPATMGLVCTMLHEGDRKYEVRIHGVEMLMEHAKHSTLDGYLACFGEDTMLSSAEKHSQPISTRTSSGIRYQAKADKRIAGCGDVMR